MLFVALGQVTMVTLNTSASPRFPEIGSHKRKQLCFTPQCLVAERMYKENIARTSPGRLDSQFLNDGIMHIDVGQLSFCAQIGWKGEYASYCPSICDNKLKIKQPC